MDDLGIITARNPQLALAGGRPPCGRLKSKAVIIPVVNGSVIHKGHNRSLAEAAHPFFLRHPGGISGSSGFHHNRGLWGQYAPLSGSRSGRSPPDGKDKGHIILQVLFIKSISSAQPARSSSARPLMRPWLSSQTERNTTRSPGETRAAAFLPVGGADINIQVLERHRFTALPPRPANGWAWRR